MRLASLRVPLIICSCIASLRAQLQALVELFRGVPQDHIRTLTLPGRPAMIGDASVVIADDRWARIIGALLFAKTDPPQDQVLVSNATGTPAVAALVVGALRGGGWNIATFIDEPIKPVSEVFGTSGAARALAHTFALTHKSGATTILRLGTDVLPAS